MINLDPTAYEMAKEIAQKHGSFSKWIREKIHAEFNRNQKTITVGWRYCKNCGYGNNSGLAWCKACNSSDKMVTHSELIRSEEE